jgi:hypothetical protein
VIVDEPKTTEVVIFGAWDLHLVSEAAGKERLVPLVSISVASKVGEE